MTDDKHSQIDYALCDLGTVCDATSEALMAHLHDGADMTCALNVLGTQLRQTWCETYDKVLEQGRQRRPRRNRPCRGLTSLSASTR